MKHLKKYSIGYNTVTSTNGVISAKGVKSKPNNLEIFGYTHEIGEGEKSPDNPYELVSLDSGAMTVDGVNYAHSIKLNNNYRTIQVPTPVALNAVGGVSDYIFKDKNGVWNLVQKCQKYELTGKENFYIQSTNKYGIVNFCTTDFEFKRTLECVCSHLKPQKTLIPSTKNEGIFAAENRYLYIRIHQNRFSTVNALKTYLAEQYQSNAPVALVCYLYTPIEYILSDYAQDLLNSFTLQNNNVIFCEGYPDIKISGYIQK